MSDGSSCGSKLPSSPDLSRGETLSAPPSGAFGLDWASSSCVHHPRLQDGCQRYSLTRAQHPSPSTASRQVGPTTAGTGDQPLPRSVSATSPSSQPCDGWQELRSISPVLLTAALSRHPPPPPARARPRSGSDKRLSPVNKGERRSDEMEMGQRSEAGECGCES